MKILLFLNGPEGCQMGIEDGFTYLLSKGELSELQWFYYNDFSTKNTKADCLIKMIAVVNPSLRISLNIIGNM